MLGAAENWRGPCAGSAQDHRSGVAVNFFSPWWHPFRSLKILAARSVGRLRPWPSKPTLAPLPFAGRPLTPNSGLCLPLLAFVFSLWLRAICILEPWFRVFRGDGFLRLTGAAQVWPLSWRPELLEPSSVGCVLGTVSPRHQLWRRAWRNVTTTWVRMSRVVMFAEF